MLGYIYYPLKSQCYAAFRKGPCRDHEYLILPKSSVIPVCVSNPCTHNNHVLFNGVCHQLDKSGPCPYPELSNVIGVNETTLEVVCTKGFTAAQVLSTLNTRFGGSSERPSNDTSTFNVTKIAEETSYPRKECFIGGKRWILEKCPQQKLEKDIESIFSNQDSISL